MLKRVDIQLCEPFTERRLLNQGRYRSTWRPPYALQAKLDGERCRALVFTNTNGIKGCLLISSTDQLITTVPHIVQAFKLLPDGEYDGELYKHGWSLADIHSVISTTTSIHPKAHEVEFHMFDIITEQTQYERFELLYKNLIIHKDARQCIKIVELNIVFNMAEIMTHYDRLIGQGYEGFIIRELTAYYIRRRSQMVMKFKPKKNDTYTLIDLQQATSENGNNLGMVGSFICVDEMETQFKVGAGKLTHPQRKEIWEEYLDGAFFNDMRQLKIEYQSLSSKNNVPNFSRALEVI